MPPYLLVMTGGALGAGARYGVARAIGGASGEWPTATLVVNIAGGFLMGLLAAAIGRSFAAEPHRLLLGVGVLGGFTTFSAFSLETVGLLGAGRTGPALAYVAASVVGSLVALALGQAAGRAL